MSTMKVQRLLALPSTLQTNTLYITKDAKAGFMGITVVGDALSSVYKTVAPSDVAALIDGDASIATIRSQIDALTAVVGDGLATRPLTRDLGTMAFVSMTWLRAEGFRASSNQPANTVTVQDVNVPGAELGDFVLPVSASVAIPDLIDLSGRVTAADTVRVLWRNDSAGTVAIPQHSFYIMLMKRLPV